MLGVAVRAHRVERSPIAAAPRDHRGAVPERERADVDDRPPHRPSQAAGREVLDGRAAVDPRRPRVRHHRRSGRVRRARAELGRRRPVPVAARRVTRGRPPRPGRGRRDQARAAAATHRQRRRQRRKEEHRDGDPQHDDLREDAPRHAWVQGRARVPDQGEQPPDPYGGGDVAEGAAPRHPDLVGQPRHARRRADIHREPPAVPARLRDRRQPREQPEDAGEGGAPLVSEPRRQGLEGPREEPKHLVPAPPPSQGAAGLPRPKDTQVTDKLCALIVIDSVGIGELPDAAAFGDVGSDTLGNIARATGGLKLPNLQALGLGNIRREAPLLGCDPVAAPRAAFGKMAEVAPGKDTATGHWELMGLVPEVPFTTYPNGFPPSLIQPFLAAIGRQRVLGNEAASGTEILTRLGAEHVASGDPIVYTSADPVLQIAAHEDVVPLETLYRWCEVAFELAVPAGLSRVIARPFVGEAPIFSRTYNRKDFTLAPTAPTFLDDLAAAGVACTGVGKIASIYAHSGVATEIHTAGNAEGIEATLEALRARSAPFVFTNLVDFDMLFGHRRDPAGYARSLEEFDAALPALLAALRPDDLLMIVADHGNDPTYRGTDHTREYVPLLAYTERVSQGRTGPVDLGVRATFADVGRTVCDYFGVATTGTRGVSFLPELLR
ncbi:MAG: phosphopentomutase [Myxococcales bacterium]|nr:phosphopentomutase [Myxococcales bacterium]